MPAILILLAILSAAYVAYGTEPIWASYGRQGIDVILWSRRLQWPLIFVAIAMCVALIVLITANKRRAWWLIGLLPVLALLYHRSEDHPAAGMRCVQDLPIETGSLREGDRIVGLFLDGQPCAIPYSTLAVDPVVIYGGREKSVILFWSAFANRAQAFIASRDLRAVDLEIVSTPNNALLVYNSRLGEFINGVTGRTTKGLTPTGLRQPVAVTKCSWGTWRFMHPDARLMTGRIPTGSQTQAEQPRFAMPGSDATELGRICVVAATQPVAVSSDAITERPLNLMAGQTAILLVRINGLVRAYNRELPADLVPRFTPSTDAKLKYVAWVDSDTNSLWTNQGTWVSGDAQMHGATLATVSVEDDLYLNVMKYWYPDLHMVTDSELAAAVVQPTAKASEKLPVIRRRKNSSR